MMSINYKVCQPPSNEDIEKARRLSFAIFGNDNEQKWKTHAQVLILALIDHNEVVVGFAAGCTMVGKNPKTPEKRTHHLWVCGVAEDFRGKGIFPELLEKFVAERQVENLSVCTYPSRFPILYKTMTHKYKFQQLLTFDDSKVYLER